METADLAGLVREIFDLDGTRARDTAGGAHLGSANDDLDDDGTVSAPDLAALASALAP